MGSVIFGDDALQVFDYFRGFLRKHTLQVSRYGDLEAQTEQGVCRHAQAFQLPVFLSDGGTTLGHIRAELLLQLLLLRLLLLLVWCCHTDMLLLLRLA